MNVKRMMGLGLSMLLIGVIPTGCAGGVNGIPNSGTIGTTSTQQSAGGMNYDEVLARLEEIDKQQDELKTREAELKSKYRNGQMTREEYTAQISDIDKQMDELDRQEDALEIQLDNLKNSGQIPATQQTTTAAQTTTSATTAPSQNGGNNAGRESILQQLAQLDVKEKELDMQEDQLEYQYRLGQIDRNTFLNKKADIERQEMEIEMKEKELELQLYNSYSSGGSAGSTGTTAASGGAVSGYGSDLMSIKRRKNELDLMEDELELKYKRGQISYSDYINQKSRIEAEEDALDRQEDWLEGDFD